MRRGGSPQISDAAEGCPLASSISSLLTKKASATADKIGQARQINQRALMLLGAAQLLSRSLFTLKCATP